MNQYSLSILKLSNIAKYDYYYEYVKPKSGKNAKLYYLDTDNLVVHTNRKTSKQIFLGM